MRLVVDAGERRRVVTPAQVIDYLNRLSRLPILATFDRKLADAMRRAGGTVFGDARAASTG